MSDLPNEYTGNEGSPSLIPGYAYRIEHQQDGSSVYLTSWGRPISIANLPAEWSAGNPQAFTQAQITHGASERAANFDKKQVALAITTQDETFRRYFLIAPAVKVRCWIMRLNTERLADPDAVLDYDTEAVIINSGVVDNIAISGQIVQATLTPEPHLTNQAVPRYYFQRTCNHALYHPQTCKVNRATYTHAATITAIDRAQRLVTLDLTSPSGTGYFRAGQMAHVPTGMIIGVNWSDEGGAGSTCRLNLRMWLPSLNIGDNVNVTAGCRHTTADCNAKFNNLANFGGFPYVPNKNPVVHGAT